MSYFFKKLIMPLILIVFSTLMLGCGGGHQNNLDLMKLPSYEGVGNTVKDRLAGGFKTSGLKDFQSGGQEIKLSLNDVVFLTLSNNQDIKVASQGPVQAKAGILEAQSIYDPEAFAEWQHSDNSNPGQMKDQTRNHIELLGLRQTIPTGATISASREWTSGRESNKGRPDDQTRAGAYVLEMNQPLLKNAGNIEARANIEISRVQANMSDEELRQVITESVGEALETYWNLSIASQNILIYEENLAMAETLLSREHSRQTEGLATELDVHRAWEAVATRTVSLINARDQHHIYQERLKLLLNNPLAPVGDNSLIIADEALESPLIKTDLNKSIETALVKRPEIRQADLTIKGGEIRKKYAKHNLLPKLDLVGRVRNNDRESAISVPGYDYDTRGDDWSVGLVFSVPLGQMKSRAALQRSESELQQSLDQNKNVKSIITTEVKIAIKSLDLIAQEIPQSQQAVVAARRVVDGEWSRFELNQIGNRDLLQAQDLLAVSERNRIQSLSRYNIAIIKLRVAEGTLLDQLGVELKEVAK